MSGMTRPIRSQFCTDGSVQAYSCLTPEQQKVRAKVVVPPSRVIPVVVVPGIMGSNLRKIKDHNVKVWLPPNGAWEAAGAGATGVVKGAQDRQKLFQPNEAEVDDSGQITMPYYDVPWLDESHARTVRGWGTVHWDSYGELLLYLETQLNHVYVEKQLQPEWAHMRQQQDSARWGAQLRDAFKPVVEDELMRLPRALFPVYAVGYNWLKSNNDSARHLQNKIEQIIAQWKAYSCTQVLVVTHSMGGLVARRCAQLAPDKIVGIVHGVLPSLGAAATYKRMRAGFEGAAAAVLGWNEAEATASMTNAVGPLELLPQASYQGGKPWLRMVAEGVAGSRYHEEKLPLQDPYAEIYEKDAKTCWYGLVNSDLIDPAKLLKKIKKDPWEMYLENLGFAQKFHKQLGNFYHPKTYAYYGADQNQRAWGEIVWRTTDLTPQDANKMMQGEHPQSDGVGKIVTNLAGKKIAFRLKDQDALGDGTVPAEASGNDPATQGVLQCFRMTGFDHQKSYANAQVRLVTLYSLCKLAQLSSLVQKE